MFLRFPQTALDLTLHFLSAGSIDLRWFQRRVWVKTVTGDTGQGRRTSALGGGKALTPSFTSGRRNSFLAEGHIRLLSAFGLPHINTCLSVTQ